MGEEGESYNSRGGGAFLPGIEEKKSWISLLQSQILISIKLLIKLFHGAVKPCWTVTHVGNLEKDPVRLPIRDIISFLHLILN